LRRGYERWQEKAKKLRCLLQQVKIKNVYSSYSSGETAYSKNKVKLVNHANMLLKQIISFQ
jgi:hypothetical protein